MEELENHFIKSFEQYSDAIFRYSLFRLGSRELAKDVTQNTFLKTWDHITKKGRILNIRAFLYKVAHNLIVDEYRSKKVESLDTLFGDDGFDPPDISDKEPGNKVDAEKALELLEEIGEEYREVVILRFVHDLSFKEIGEIIGESENASAVRLHRAIKKLKRKFDGKPNNK